MKRGIEVRTVWRDRQSVLPVSAGRTVLRELRASDADSLVPLMSDPEVRRHLPGAPATERDFRRFVSWVERQRRGGRHFCVAVTLNEQAIGMIQAWPLEPSAQTVEWGFALGRPFWGQGLFQEAGRKFVELALTHLKVQRLEARTAVANGRAMAALRRIGADSEGIMRECFTLDDKRADCQMWSLLASRWHCRSGLPQFGRAAAA